MLVAEDLDGSTSSALERLSDGGHHGLAATQDGRAVAVMTVAVREHPALDRHARLPAEGFAVEPDLADPAGILAAAFGDLASPLIASGVLHLYLLHTALPRMHEALSNLGFGRNGAYGIQPAAPLRYYSAVAVHVADAGHLDSIAPGLGRDPAPLRTPIFAPRQPVVPAFLAPRRLPPGRIRRSALAGTSTRLE
jgi:hypothetical protein